MASDNIYDIAIIGGGINGVGIARDAAGRGYRVALIEQGDLAQGTSSSSTKLIHGGLRYLEHYAFRLVREALKEREILLAIAPHIVRPMRFVLPVRPGMRPAWLIRTGLFLYDHLGGRRRLGGTRTLDLGADAAGEALKAGFAKAFEYADCWVDDARLVVLNARDAAERGAAIRTRCRAVSAKAGGHEGARHWVVALEDRGQGARREIAARVLVNAGGPWGDAIAGNVIGCNQAARMRLVQGSHIVVPRLFEHDKSYIFQNDDGRVVFAIPYEGAFTMIGTTEVDYQGDPAAARMSAGERDYMLAVANNHFRRQTRAGDIVWSFSGVRALVEDGEGQRGGAAQAQSRDYRIEVSRPAGAPLVTIVGGKITTYRRLAESALEEIDRELGRRTRTWTAAAALPGGDFEPDHIEDECARLAAAYRFLTPGQCRRLVSTYGTLARDMLGDARQADDLGVTIGAGLSEREVCYLNEKEWARSGDDILWRRTKLGLFLNADERRRVDEVLARRAASET